MGKSSALDGLNSLPPSPRAEMEQVLSHIGVGFALFDLQGKLVQINPQFEMFYGLSKGEALGLSYKALLEKNLEKGLYLVEQRQKPGRGVIGEDSKAWLQGRLQWFEAPLLSQEERLAKGTWLEVTAKIQADGSKLLVLQDVTEERLKEVRLSHQAFHDSLTGVGNRSLLESALHDIEMTQQPHAFMFIDVNGFKNVNDALGHDVGDYLLISVAQQLQSCTRMEDQIFRVGGDEFVILLNGVDQKKDALTFAERMQEAVSELALEGVKHTPFSVSIGISLYPQDGTIAQVLKKADRAMYQNKKKGKDALSL